MCKAKLEKKEGQCELNISSIKTRHTEEVDTLERQVKRLKSTLEQRNISINALKERVQFYRGVAYETRNISINALKERVQFYRGVANETRSESSLDQVVRSHTHNNQQAQHHAE